ncbi:MAG: MerR family transcriptional regulator [Rhizobiaceae bacterium]
MLKISEAARRIGVAEAALRTWFARAPDHNLGRMVGKARVFDRDDLVVLAIWAALIQGGAGPPHVALATANRVARMRCATAYAAANGITEAPPTHAAIAVPLAAIRQRLGGKPQ